LGVSRCLIYAEETDNGRSLPGRGRAAGITAILIIRRTISERKRFVLTHQAARVPAKKDIASAIVEAGLPFHPNDRACIGCGQFLRSTYNRGPGYAGNFAGSNHPASRSRRTEKRQKYHHQKNGGDHRRRTEDGACRRCRSVSESTRITEPPGIWLVW